jgi:uncharacterized protein
MSVLKSLIQRLLHIEDTPERTALAFAIGVFLGFSPFLGFHTLLGLALAFLFRLNRIAVLLGVWSNTPWFLLPFYTFATWVGMAVVGFQIDPAFFKDLLQLGIHGGFWKPSFWGQLTSQWGLLLSFGIGSLLLSALLSLIAYLLSLRGIYLVRSREKGWIQKAKRSKETLSP